MSSISLRTTLSKSIDHRAQRFYLKTQQQQQPAATLQYSLTTFLVPNLAKIKLEQTEARRAEKKFGVRSRPFPKGLDDRPLSPAPLSRGLDLARKSIAKEWSLAI